MYWKREGALWFWLSVCHQVGDPVRFYHKEMEAYLVAEGLFDDELIEDGQ